MKSFKIIISVVLCVLISCSAFVISAEAKTTKKYVKSVSVKSKATITIPANKKTVTKSFSVKVKVKGKVSKKFTAKSSKTSVATVKVSGSKIKVTAKKAGVAKITVTTKAKNAKGKKLSKKLTVTVKKQAAPSKTPATKPAAPDDVAEKEGKITEEKLSWYSFEAGEIKGEENPVYFSSKYPDVPFVSDSFVIKNFLEMLGYNPECKVENSDSGLAHTYSMPMGTSVGFNYDSKLMIFSDYTSTLVLNGDYMIFNPFSVAAAKNGPFYKVSDKDIYHGGDPIAVTFAYDEVPMLKNGNDILIPLQTFSDFFMSFTGQFLSYNGKGVFIADSSIAQDPNKKEYYKLYSDSVKTDTISSALAQVNYYEFCNGLDAHYGLQAAHNIANFDEYFTRMGIKKKMLSTDLATIEKAQQDIATLLFEDFHSGSGMQSVFLSEPLEYQPQLSPVFIDRYKRSQNIEKTRDNALGTLGKDFSAYERVGDTVFITFDAFKMDSSFTSYVSEGYEPTADPNDTISLFAYALKRLQNEDKDAKNVVIDLACDGGGAVFAGGYAMQAICGKCNINIQNPITWAIHQCVLDYDLNFDGKYDENDKSMLDMGFNVAINISDASFSCGNLLPCALDQLDDRVLLIGQQSGGGACVVGSLSTAIGSTMQISSEYRMSTMKNGYIRDIDGGIAPDVHLTLNKMFDREYIDKLLSEQFSLKEYKTKKLPVLRDKLDSTETATVRYYSDQPNVPYMNVTDFYNQFYLVGTELKEGMKYTKSGDKYTLTNIAGDSATFDTKNETIYTTNLEDFTSIAHAVQIRMSGDSDENYPFVKMSSTVEPADATPITLNLKDYGIDLRGDETGVYAPLSTITDIFSTPEAYYVVCTGEKIYTKDFSKALQPTAAIDSDPDLIKSIEKDHPADLADFTYHELCFNLDLWYGQPGQELIHNDLKDAKIDDVLTEKYPDIKKQLLSTDFKTFYSGLTSLTNGLLFDGGHTTSTLSRLFSEDEKLLEDTLTALQPVDYMQRFFYNMIGRTKDINTRTKTRDAAYKGDYYIENGDTAMIHFDSFVVDYDGWKAFYAGKGDRPLTFKAVENGQNVTKYDTVGTVLSGLERAKKNPSIKNIVIDMSCNGGGDEAAMLCVEWLMKGKGSISFESSITKRVKTEMAAFDMNFDGKFDDKDVSPYTDYNFGVLTSNYAFSCGNAYPWFMHENGCAIMGQKTSGGACAIRLSSSAGVEFACSAASSRIVSKSGENVDFGCPVDYDLISENENPYENFYDLSILSEKMNDFYSK